MAKRNYLVEGLSGAGKSSVHQELIRRGYAAISTDRAWAYHADPDTGLPGGPVSHDNWMWDQQKAVIELESPDPEVLFVCGTAVIATASCPFSPRYSISASTMKRCVAASTSALIMSLASSRKKSKSC